MKILPMVGPNQAVVLEYLSEHGESTVQEIAENSDLTAKQLREAIRPLERKELVESRPNPANPNQKLRCLTSGME